MRTQFYEVPIDAWLFRRASGTDPASPPEEQVRQWCLHELIRAYGISICDMVIEHPVKVARERKANRIDIVVRRNGKPYIVIECKARGATDHDAAMGQACNYASLPEVGAEFAVYTNGEVWWVRRCIRGEWVTVPDLPVFRDGNPDREWRDTLLAVNQVAPVLFWLDEVVPAKNAPRYFGALQMFFYGVNEITAGINPNLLCAADNILRVLDDVSDHPNYTGGKMSHACAALNRYWQGVGKETHFGGNDLWEMAHSAWAELSNLLEGSRGMVMLDHQVMRVILALLNYLDGIKGRRVRYLDVATSLQSEIRNYIDLALKVRFNSSLPDTQDSISIGDIRKFCEPAWISHLRR